MTEENRLPELKEIVGALLFAAGHPVSAAQIRGVLKDAANSFGGICNGYATASEARVAAAIEEVNTALLQAAVGFHVMEVAHGFRLENDPACGPWLRQFLNRHKSGKLSQPALETLAIIAYRQPCTRAEIEAVRGVSVDQIVHNLLEMQLIHVTGRSDLPGHPWLLGTTQYFLEHFGLRGLDDLPGIEELRRMESRQLQHTHDNGNQAKSADNPEANGKEDQE